MVHFIVPYDQIWIIHNIKERVPDDISSKIQVIPYEKLHHEYSLRTGTCIFTGINVITDVQREIGTEVWSQLELAEPDIILMNHPQKALDRHELLNALYNKGINDFSAYRIKELEEITPEFPVFVREARRHTGSLTDLIPDREALEKEITRLVKNGYDTDDMLVVEYSHTADEYGLYRKYSALKLGDAILPRYLSLSYNWMVKENEPDPPGGVLYDDTTVEEELSYIRNNPHEEQLRNIFKVANIDYGRIDYGIKNGRIVVWEINTHPTFGFEPGIPRTKRNTDRKQKRFPAKTHFYESLEDAFRNLLTYKPTPEISISLSKDLYRLNAREYRKKMLVNAAIRMGQSIPRVPFMARAREILKRRIKQISDKR